MEEITLDELGNLSLTNLRKLAKEQKIEGYSTIPKMELLNRLCYSLATDQGLIYSYGELDIINETYGFLRNTPQNIDVYVSNSQIKKFGLRQGDVIVGEVRKPLNDEKNFGLLRLIYVNGEKGELSRQRPMFDDLIPSYPIERLDLGEGTNSSRIIDLIAPIGKGQRGLIVAPPKAGKTTILSDLANDILKYNKDVQVWIILIDERPEEVTDIKENVKNAEIFAATFDENTSVHLSVTEKVLEAAKREIEKGNDIVILMDSLTRLARSYNIEMPSSGKLLSGGIDPKSLYMPKKFLGAARKIRGGGSLTILATALIETGSRMDEVIFEEFKGTGNMELVLDRTLQQLRLFPAVDILKSGTRKEELLYSKREFEAILKLRKFLLKLNEAEALKFLMDLIKRYSTNRDLLENIDYELKL
ncbi:transcription termination factor Rho [Streptobacillus canis]|uniref:transcription termination factor Rho n=1 Tax=Streptobacillus canis TaxID=2678686 RepID=UPI0012E2F47D|nr:transcription termination factor Rho [Streptobacillus canis]